jgi:5-dehydro-2-deoxygluconokinase
MADLTRLKGGSFLVIGRAGMDLMPDPPGTPIEAATRFVSALGGSSANIAAALTRQGCEAALLSCLSDDAVGRFCLAELDRYGIDRRHVRLTRGEARTSLALSESLLEGHQTVIYRNGAADFALTVADVEAVDVAAFSALVVTGTALAADPSRTATLRALELVRAAGLPLILDLDYRPYSWASRDEAARVCGQAAALCDIVVGNDVEFGVLAGDEAHGIDHAWRMASSGAQVVVYKMGEDGALTFAEGREIRTGIFPTTPLKPTGAGDAFLGAFLAALARGWDTGDALRRGSAAAAMVVGRVGCAPAMPDAEELDRFLAAHSITHPAKGSDRHAHPAP